MSWTSISRPRWSWQSPDPAPRPARPLDGPARLILAAVGPKQSGAGLLSRRFLRAYRDANPGTDLTQLDWYIALHSVRVVLDLTRWRQTGYPRADTHAFRLVAPGAARAVRRATGIGVRVS